jgi:hypothetical protein
MISFYYDRIVDGVVIPNGIPDKFVKYYTPFFNDNLFRKEVGVEPAVYPSDMRQKDFCNLFSVDRLSKQETSFKGYYLIEGFGSAQNAMGVNPETKDKYKVVFNYIKQDTLKFLQNGTLTLCVCYIQESFVTDNIIHSIHYNTKKLNIQNSIVIVNDFLVEERYKTWCEENNEEPRFKTIVFCHSLYEKSYEIYELQKSKQVYDMASDYQQHKSSAMTLEEFKDTKSILRKNTILSMNRRQREHRLATLCVLNHYGLLKGNGVSYQLTFDGPTTPYYVDKLITDESKQKKYYQDYRELQNMKYQWVDYPIAMEAKDGVHHGYGWENKEPYLNSYLNITTETDFINPTGYASEKVWKPFGFFQPVLLVGSPNTLQFVRSFGFKTFNGFIDESYDKEIDNAKRFELIEKEIIKFSKMSKQEVHDWYWSMEDILVHNFNLFMEYGKNRQQNYKKLIKELK